MRLLKTYSHTSNGLASKPGKTLTKVIEGNADTMIRQTIVKNFRVPPALRGGRGEKGVMIRQTTVKNLPRRGRLRKIGRGLPEQRHFVCGVFERRIKRRRCQSVASRVGNFGLAMSPSGNTRPRQFGSVMSSSGNTRPREHDASPNSRFLASCYLRSLAKNRKNLL